MRAFGYISLPPYTLDGLGAAANPNDMLYALIQQADAWGKRINAEFSPRSDFMKSVIFTHDLGELSHLTDRSGKSVFDAFWAYWNDFTSWRSTYVKADLSPVGGYSQATIESKRPIAIEYRDIFRRIFNLLTWASAEQGGSDAGGGYSEGAGGQSLPQNTDSSIPASSGGGMTNSSGGGMTASSGGGAANSSGGGGMTQTTEPGGPAAPREPKGMSPLTLILGAAAAYLLWDAYQSSQSGTVPLYRSAVQRFRTR